MSVSKKTRGTWNDRKSLSDLETKRKTNSPSLKLMKRNTPRRSRADRRFPFSAEAKPRRLTWRQHRQTWTELRWREWWGIPWRLAQRSSTPWKHRRRRQRWWARIAARKPLKWTSQLSCLKLLRWGWEVQSNSASGYAGSSKFLDEIRATLASPTTLVPFGLLQSSLKIGWAAAPCHPLWSCFYEPRVGWSRRQLCGRKFD